MTTLDYQPLYILLCAEPLYTQEVKKLFPDDEHVVSTVAKPKIFFFRNERAYRHELKKIVDDGTLDVIKTLTVDLSENFSYHGDGSVHTVYAHTLFASMTTIIIDMMTTFMAHKPVARYIEEDKENRALLEEQVKDDFQKADREMQIALYYLFKPD